MNNGYFRRVIVGSCSAGMGCGVECLVASQAPRKCLLLSRCRNLNINRFTEKRSGGRKAQHEQMPQQEQCGLHNHLSPFFLLSLVTTNFNRNLKYNCDVMDNNTCQSGYFTHGQQAVRYRGVCAVPYGIWFRISSERIWERSCSTEETTRIRTNEPVPISCCTVTTVKWVVYQRPPFLTSSVF